MDGTGERPVLRVVKGDPTAAELAALVAVVAARAAASAAVSAGPETPPPTSPWRDRGRNVRPPLAAGSGAWRASGLPR